MFIQQMKQEKERANSQFSVQKKKVVAA